MTFCTNVHFTVPVTIAVLITGAYLIWKRRYFWFTSLVLTVPFGMLLNVLMKYAFHRTRPGFENPLLVHANDSFPSGRVAALGCTIIAGINTAWLSGSIW